MVTSQLASSRLRGGVLALFLISSLLSSEKAVGQTNVKIPANVFPMMAFQFGAVYDSSNIANLEAGWFNYLYDGGFTPSSNPWIKNGMKAVYAFGLIASEDDNLNPPRRYFGGHEGNFVADAIECRFFLAGNEGQYLKDSLGQYTILDHPEYAYDMRHNWVNAVGVVSNKEWQIGKLTTLADSAYILKTLNFQDQYLSYFGDTDSEHTAFIYRLDPLDSVSGSNPLFQIEYTLTFAKDSAADITIKYDSVQFSYNDYAAFIATSHPREHPHLLTFPNSFYGHSRNTLTPHPYALVYRNVPTHLPSDGSYGLMSDGINMEVKRLAPAIIYVRGVRIRSDFAEKILTDDSATIAEAKRLFNAEKAIIQSGSGGGADQWSNTTFLGAGPEPQGPELRTMAHIDMVLWKAYHKHTIPFIANNTLLNTTWAWYRSIYEDETDSVPPPISAENLEYENGANGKDGGFHFAPVPVDAVDYIFQSFSLRDKQIQAITGDVVVEDSLVGLHDHHPITVNATYDLYTARTRYHQDLYSFYNAALGAYPAYTTPDRFGSFYAHMNTILSFSGVYDSVFRAIPPPSAAFTAVVEDSILHGVNPGHEDPIASNQFPISLIDTSHWLQMFSRATTAEEVRANGWLALCYGAKGLVANTVTDDGGENHGTKAEQADTERYDYDLTQSKLFASIYIGDADRPVIPFSFFDELDVERDTIVYSHGTPSFVPSLLGDREYE